jgi:hypothetical protein
VPVRRILLLLLVFLLLPAAPAQARVLEPSVLVVGVAGLQWADVGPQTPVLQELVRSGAVGALSVKAVPAVSCPADGWLTLGAGNRAVADGIGRGPCTGEIPGPGAFPAQLAANEDTRQGVELGALASALDGCVQLEGEGPALAVQPGQAGGPSCPLRLAQAPPVTGAGTVRAARAVRADREIGRLLQRGRGTTVIVVGLAEGVGDRTAALHVAIAVGPSFPAGALRSASTRRAPYVQLVDVAPTVLDLLDVPVPESMTGQRWQSVGDAPTPAELADLAEQARVSKAVTVPFFATLLAGELLLILLALWRRRPDLAELVALGGVAALGASYLANLVPWWRSPAPLLTLLAVVLVVSSGVVAAAVLRRGVLAPVGLVCGVTAGVILLDLLTGAQLQMSSVAGYSPLVAGRFAGIGNVAFGVLAAAALLATAALTRRTWGVAAVGALTVLVDGAPPWGSDVGGVLALVPAFALLALLLSGRRITVFRLLGAGLAGAAVVTAFALADWSRPAQDRTHLGRFVQDLADGTAGTLLRRKADAVLDLLLASPVTALLPLVVVAAVSVVIRPPAPLARAFAAAPAWRSGLVALGLASAIGFAVNDSGAAVPALALAVAVPATIAVVLRARRVPAEPSRC